MNPLEWKVAHGTTPSGSRSGWFCTRQLPNGRGAETLDDGKGRVRLWQSKEAAVKALTKYQET